MQPGQLCRLRGLEDWVWRAPRAPRAVPKERDEWIEPLVLGYLVGAQPHTEDVDRQLYFFHPVQVVLLWASEGSAKTETTPSLTARRVVYKRFHPPTSSGVIATVGKAERHRRSDLHMGTHSFTSTDGYVYKHSGWYNACDLEVLTEEEVLTRYGVSVRRIAGEAAEGTPPASRSTSGTSASTTAATTLPQSWVAAMDAASACCEVRYLCYAFRPWFASAFERLPHLALPERQLCYSVHLCHRCITPFFSLEQLTVHLDGYCPHGRRPPGPLLYHDRETGRKIYFVDGAQHLHYGRCLSLLGKGFIESKLIQNDVDVYEFFVVSLPRHTIPFIATSPAGSGDVSERVSASSQSESRAFRAFVSNYDADEWEGDVVAGYFSRLKHQPHHALSCIMTLPCFQRMQLGSFMLDAAYAFAQARQEQCGCRALCGSTAEDGASISRPFSPHGQALLLAYWRRALLTSLWKKHELAKTHDGHAEHPQHHAQRDVDGGVKDNDDATGTTRSSHESTAPTLCAATLDDLRRWLPIPISLDDLQFLLLHSDIAFYVPASRRDGGAEVAAAAHPRRRTLSLTTSTPPERDAPRHHDFAGSLVFDLSEVEGSGAGTSGHTEARVTGQTLAGSFYHQWLLRLPNGQLVYNRSLFHH